MSGDALCFVDPALFAGKPAEKPASPATEVDVEEAVLRPDRVVEPARRAAGTSVSPALFADSDLRPIHIPLGVYPRPNTSLLRPSTRLNLCLASPTAKAVIAAENEMIQLIHRTDRAAIETGHGYVSYDQAYRKEFGRLPKGEMNEASVAFHDAFHKAEQALRYAIAIAKPKSESSRNSATLVEEWVVSMMMDKATSYRNYVATAR